MYLFCYGSVGVIALENTAAELTSFICYSTTVHTNGKKKVDSEKSRAQKKECSDAFILAADTRLPWVTHSSLMALNKELTDHCITVWRLISGPIHTCELNQWLLHKLQLNRWLIKTNSYWNLSICLLADEAFRLTWSGSWQPLRWAWHRHTEWRVNPPPHSSFTC